MQQFSNVGQYYFTEDLIDTQFGFNLTFLMIKTMLSFFLSFAAIEYLLSMRTVNVQTKQSK